MYPNVSVDGKMYPNVFEMVKSIQMYLKRVNCIQAF